MDVKGPVKVAMLGCGGYMGVHASRLVGNADTRLVGLCDVRAEIAAAFARKHLSALDPAPRLFDDPAEMYRETKPDAVFIASPHTLHYRHAVQAIDAGCHIYMEKPMVTSLDDAYRLADKVAQAGRILVVGYNSPCSPEFAYLRQAIRNRTFGRLELVTGILTQGWMAGTKGKWRQDPALSGGGQAYDSGAHMLNSLCWSVESDVASVFGFVDNHGTAVDINSAFVIRFANGVMASLAVGGNCPAPMWSANMTFAFEEGRIDIDGWGGRWIKVWAAKEEVKYPAITPDMGFPSPTENFIAAVLGRAEPRTSVHNGIVQSQLMNALYESARTGRPAAPPPRPA
jgi:predicted dehydrogenase